MYHGQSSNGRLTSQGSEAFLYPQPPLLLQGAQHHIHKISPLPRRDYAHIAWQRTGSEAGFQSTPQLPPAHLQWTKREGNG